MAHGSLQTEHQRGAKKDLSKTSWPRLIEVAYSDEPKNLIEEYVQDMYTYSFYDFKRKRANQRQCYLTSHSDITPRERESVANYIVKMHQMLYLVPETLYLAVSIFDRFLSQDTVERVEVNLVAMCAMLIASKYEEVRTPLPQELTGIWKMRYSTSDVLKMEKRILTKLEWSISFPTPYMFLVSCINTEKTDEETERMIFFYSELALMQHLLIEVPPSLIAASCVYTARRTLKKSPLWPESLQRSTRYSDKHLLKCAKVLMHAHSIDSKAPKSTRSFVYEKYSSEEFKKVALHVPVLE